MIVATAVIVVDLVDELLRGGGGLLILCALLPQVALNLLVQLLVERWCLWVILLRLLEFLGQRH